MSDDLLALQSATDAALSEARDLRAWDAIRVGVLGKSGSLTEKLKGLGTLPPDQCCQGRDFGSD
jgi:phenylalanyl-tRNA synthetase alpha chain